jgi:hypothetical protein
MSASPRSKERMAFFAGVRAHSFPADRSPPRTGGEKANGLSGASNQQWQANSPFTFRFGGFPTNPTYFQNPATGLVIDVAQGSKADDAVVIGWYYNGGSNQLWDHRSREP